MIKTLQRRFALSRQGAVDLIKGCIACVVQDISFMLPVGLLYYLQSANNYVPPPLWVTP